MYNTEEQRNAAIWWGNLTCDERTELRKQFNGNTLTAEQIDILYSQFKNKIPCNTNQSLKHLGNQ